MYTPFYFGLINYLDHMRIRVLFNISKMYFNIGQYLSIFLNCISNIGQSQLVKDYCTIGKVLSNGAHCLTIFYALVMANVKVFP